MAHEGPRAFELGGGRRWAGEELEWNDRRTAGRDVCIELGAGGVEIPPVAEMHPRVKVEALEIILIGAERQRPLEVPHRLVETT